MSAVILLDPQPGDGALPLLGGADLEGSGWSGECDDLVGRSARLSQGADVHREEDLVALVVDALGPGVTALVTLAVVRSVSVVETAGTGQGDLNVVGGCRR